MNKTKMILNKLIKPKKSVLIILPPIVFAMLIFIFATKNNTTLFAYPIFCLSFYSIVILVIAIPKMKNAVKNAVKNLIFKIFSSKAFKKMLPSGFGDNYLHNAMFRGSISIYHGFIANALYAIFRIITGIKYSSIWFVSMAIYYIILAIMRVYLIYGYKHKRNTIYEYRYYSSTAKMLFLLNIPMGGMILLMIIKDSSYNYPEYIIYLSALYTFYIMTISIINLVKSKKWGSPILSAAKVLNLISAMMSILGLQTSMISHFSHSSGSFRKTMNTITGSLVYFIVIVLAVYMIIRSHKTKKILKKVKTDEQV